MADINRLRGDVEWWITEVENKQRAVTEAMRSLKDRVHQLAEEAERISREPKK